MNCYIDPLIYQRAPTGMETATLVGACGYLGAAGAAQGTTTLPLALPLQMNLPIGTRVTLFEGGSSEVITLTQNASVGVSTSLTVTATQYAHTGACVFCTDGFYGSLADVMVRASRRLENKCMQSLMQASYTDTLPLQSMQAAISKEHQLYIRPRNFPVTAVTALSIESVANQSLTLDPSQAIIDTLRQSVYVPILQAAGAGGSGSWSYVFQTLPFDMSTPGDIIITYTSGFAYASMPVDVQEACILYASAELARRLNPTGAAETMMNKTRTRYRIVGDPLGANALAAEADRLLERGNYVRKAW